MKKLINRFIAATLILAPSFVFAAGTGLRDLIVSAQGIVSRLLVLVAGLALLAFFWGLARFIFKAGDVKAKEEGKNIMIWGVAALFVMVSVWGIIRLLQKDLGVENSSGIIQLRVIP